MHWEQENSESVCTVPYRTQIVYVATDSSDAALKATTASSMVYHMGMLTWRGAAAEDCGDLPQLLLPQPPEV